MNLIKIRSKLEQKNKKRVVLLFKNLNYKQTQRLKVLIIYLNNNNKIKIKMEINYNNSKLITHKKKNL